MTSNLKPSHFDLFSILIGGICLFQQFLLAIHLLFVANTLFEKSVPLIMVTAQVIILLRIISILNNISDSLFYNIASIFSYFIFIIFEIVRLFYILSANDFLIQDKIIYYEKLSENYRLMDINLIGILLISNIFLFFCLQFPWPTLGIRTLRRDPGRAAPVKAKKPHGKALEPIPAERHPATPQLRKNDRTPRTIYIGAGYVIGLETRPSGEPLEKPYCVGQPIEGGEVHWLTEKNYQLLGQAVAAGEALRSRQTE